MTENKATRTFRVPTAVQNRMSESLAAGNFVDPIDVTFATMLSSGEPVGGAAIQWLKERLDATRNEAEKHGGDTAQNWAAKFSNPTVLTASALSFDDENTYYAVGENADAPEQASQLLIVDKELSLSVWADGGPFPLPDAIGDYDAPTITELSPEDAQEFASWLDDPTRNIDEFFNITDIDPEERNLMDLAFSEIDWEEIDRLAALTADATGYSPIERSDDAAHQPRAGDGRFGGPQVPTGTTLSSSLKKAELPENLEIVTDPSARLEDATTEGIYFAVVNAVDSLAVLDVISVTRTESGELEAFKRSEGEWVSAPEQLQDLQGDPPPPVVELSGEELVKNILMQVDAWESEPAEEDPITAAAYELTDYAKETREKDAKKGMALPDGSFPIHNVADLKNAIQAYGRAKDKDAAMKHIKKRARALNRTDLIPSDWKETSIIESSLYGEFGEIISVVAAGTPGIADTPSDQAAVNRLKRYWAFGPGVAKWRPGTPGDLTRLARALTKYVGPDRAWGLAQNIFKMRFGINNADYDKKAGT